MNHYEQKQEAKRARLEQAAERAARLSESRFTQSSNMASAIPFGQPILVGHHSEGRDRNYRAKIERTARKGIEADKKAAHLHAKAAAVGTGGISSDDPDAIDKLCAELTEREKKQDIMKRANKLVRKDDKAGLINLGYSEAVADELLKGDVCGRKGFPTYALSNNNASIKRIRDRIKALEARQSMSDYEKAGAGYTYREDTTENRVMFMFDGKPSADVRQVLKRHAFKWSPSRCESGAWVRHLTNAGRFAGKQVREALDKLAT